MPSPLILALILAFLLGQPDETLRRYGAENKTWVLTSLNGAAFNGHVTLTFPRRNVFQGQAPCNSYSSTNSMPYPWFEAGPIAATRRACADLSLEADYFAALGAASIAIVEGDRLTLSTEDAPLLVFKSAD